MDNLKYCGHNIYINFEDGNVFEKKANCFEKIKDEESLAEERFLKKHLKGVE